MKEITITSTIKLYSHLHKLSRADDVRLCQQSMTAMKGAYAPYSNYKVGAAVLLDDGRIVSGSNQENAVYPLGLCAERVVMYGAAGQYPERIITHLAIATTKELNMDELPPFPCGSCRQVLLEMEQRYQHDITLYIVGSNQKVCEIASAQALLPFAFDQQSL